MAVLKAPTPGANEYFGAAVAISGNFAVVGVYTHNSYQGAVYVFRIDDDNCEYMTTLTASDGVAGDQFGRSVAVSGNYIVVGAPEADTTDGAAYLFRYDGDSWGIPSALSGSNGRLDCPFYNDGYAGWSVDIDGDYIAVGAPLASGAGIVYIFYRNQGSSNSWNNQANLTSGDPANQYGYRVAISGSYVAIGAPDDDADNSGAVYFHRRSGTSSWAAVPEKIKQVTPVADNRFGESLDIYGTTLLVGIPNTNAVKIFKLDGSSWERKGTLESKNSVSGDAFGNAVSITDDYILVGAKNRDVSVDATQAGAAYLFENINKIEELNLITSNTPADNDNLGEAVSICPDYAIIGIPCDDVTSIDSGKVIIYLKEE
jgi:hypothetical protein